MKMWTYQQWKESTGMGSYWADRVAGNMLVSQSSYQSAAGVGVRNGDFFYAAMEPNDWYDLPHYIVKLHFISKESNEDYPLVAFEKSYGHPFHFQKFRSRTDAEKYLNMLVESGGVKTAVIEAFAEKEKVAFRKAERDAKQKAYQEHQKLLKEKENTGCAVLLSLMAFAAFVSCIVFDKLYF